MIVCDRAHEKGLLLYPTLLVQQNSGDRGFDTRGSNFRFDNKQLEIGARGDLAPDTWGADCLDFKHKEVRDERFALIEETLKRYPVDGFELHMDYWPCYFHPDEVVEGLDIMTGWIRRVYEAVKKSGAERELAVRVPGDMEKCMAVGMDVRGWIDQGLVDVVIAEDTVLNGFVTYWDARPFVEAAEGSPCRVYAVIGSTVDSDRLAEAPIEMVRAAATNLWAQGVDGLYLAQWFCNWPYTASFYEKLRELPHPDVMAPRDKHYFVPTTTGRFPKDPVKAQVSDGLPVDMEGGEPVTVRLNISDELSRWDRIGRVHEVLLRLRIVNTTELDRLVFKLNGKELPEGLLRKINQMYRMSAPRYRVNNCYWFIFKLDRTHWPVQGENAVQVTLVERDPDVAPQLYLRDVELEIKYLMGKNFHRGFVDQDLGPYERSVE